MVWLMGFEPFTTGQGLVLMHNPTADTDDAGPGPPPSQLDLI